LGNLLLSYKAETRALEEAMKETGIKKSLILTLDHDEEVLTDSGIIKMLPTSEFFISCIFFSSSQLKFFITSSGVDCT